MDGEMMRWLQALQENMTEAEEALKETRGSLSKAQGCWNYLMAALEEKAALATKSEDQNISQKPSENTTSEAVCWCGPSMELLGHHPLCPQRAAASESAETTPSSQDTRPLAAPLRGWPTSSEMFYLVRADQSGALRIMGTVTPAERNSTLTLGDALRLLQDAGWMLETPMTWESRSPSGATPSTIQDQGQAGQPAGGGELSHECEHRWLRQSKTSEAHESKEGGGGMNDARLESNWREDKKREAYEAEIADLRRQLEQRTDPDLHHTDEDVHALQRQLAQVTQERDRYQELAERRDDCTYSAIPCQVARGLETHAKALAEAASALDSMLSYLAHRGRIDWTQRTGFDLTLSEVDQRSGQARAALTAWQEFAKADGD